MNIHSQTKSAIWLSVFFTLTISAIMFLLPACVVTAARGPYYSQDPAPRPGDFGRIQGQWFVVIANNPGKLEFSRDGHRWAGRLWIDYYAKWENLTDILFDTRTGELQFTRPAFNARYSGTLSGNQILGTVIYQGVTYSWEATREARRLERFLDLRRIQGEWFVVIANNPGKLEFSWDGHRWAGRLWIDYYAKWEDLTDILFDTRTGELQFTRPAFNARYFGTFSGNQISGTVIYQGVTYSWEATKEATRRGPLLDLRSIQGLWFVTIANNQGKLEFYWNGHRWASRLWIDAYSRWEELTDIFFNTRTGELQFTRPAFNARYFGTSSGNQISGTVTYEGVTYSWAARRQ